ncbi:HEPN domain-containing protein [Polaribacter sp. Hel1_85]|uniref:HEPN domain-containing protein n=1 Tax=Polaribacter sp. Hel1_85 TaxID=1250005 RepID=UPI00052CFE67|nr:HEPN domain-containing protein [Polaribacter sp. Hel1_85]KGL59097.1 hypothetical protein PHEL85_3371 [Polaribacter sp. Hel1_85]
MKEQETKGGKTSGIDNPKVDAVSSGSKEDTKSISSFDVFEKCLIRAENLLSVHDSTETIKEITEKHYCDCYRAAVVLTISALDAFVRKIVISEIRKVVSDTKKTIKPELKDYLKKLLNQDKLLDAARNYNFLEKVEKAVKDDFETKSFQGEWKITSFLKMVGHDNIFSSVAVKANINESNLKRKLNLFTSRRHVIAHSGDYNLNQTPHSENDINKNYAKECIEIVRLFASNIHEIIEQ